MGVNRINANLESSIKLWRPDGSAYELLSASGITRSMPRQISQDYMIGVVEQGRATIEYRSENYKVDGGCFLLLNPGEPFGRRGCVEYPRTVRMLIASPAFLQQQIAYLTEGGDGLPYFGQPITLNREIIRGFSRIHRALELPHSRLERDSWLQDIVVLLLKYGMGEQPELPPLRRESDRVKKVRAFLLERFTENTALDQLAALVNLSPYRLNRVFSQEVGVPPHAFLNQVRVWHAKALLEKGVPLAQIAIEVGFYDQSHLTRHFKRLMGYTPGVILGDKTRRPSR